MFRFSFGKNWVSYSKNIGTIHIKNSEKDLKKFLKKNIKNKKIFRYRLWQWTFIIICKKFRSHRN